MRLQRLYNGVRFPMPGPSLRNVQRLDHYGRPMMIAMRARGMQVDLSHFAKLDTALTEDMERLTDEVQAMTGQYVNLGSGPQVSHLLFKTLGLKQPRPRFTPSGDRESVDHEALVAVQHDHEVVPLLLDYKEVDKLRGTYVRPMPGLATRVSHGVWRIFPQIGDTRVPSGRQNCKEPNLLAMPNRTKRGQQVCEGFITDPGWSFLSVDESQIEPRVTAHRSGCPELRRIYENEEDIYSDFAIRAFHLPDSRHRDTDGWHYPGVDKKLHRFPSKTCILAAIYEVSPKGLLEQMPTICKHCHTMASDHREKGCQHFTPYWTETKCAEILSSFYHTYAIAGMRKRDHARARFYGYLWDEWGRILHVAAVRSVHEWVQSGALREAGNFPIQSTARGTVKLTSAAVWDDLNASGMYGTTVWPLLDIHDELLFEVRDDVLEEIADLVKWRFETCVALDVPIKAGSASSAESWGKVPK